MTRNRIFPTNSKRKSILNSKTALQEGRFAKSVGELFNRVFESFCRAELRSASSCDANRFTRARIASFACGTRLRYEDAEARNGYLVALFKPLVDGRNESFDGAFRVCFRTTEYAVYLVDNVSFIHRDFLRAKPQPLH